MKTTWSEKSVFDKIMLILRIVVSVAVMVCASLQLAGVWDNALNIAVPLLAVLILIQSVQEHRQRKNASAIIGYVCFFAMAVMTACALLIK